MSSYKQLAQEERYTIYGFCKAGFTVSTIAREMDRHPSTIWREIKRNSGKRGYRPKQAQHMSVSRRHSARKAIKFTPKVRAVVTRKIKQEWSPDQISGWLSREHGPVISHERIYQFLLQDKADGGMLYRYLRRSNRKYKKRYGAPDRRGQIPNRTFIDQRPDHIDNKMRLGDWEGDTVIGRGHRGALVTLVERKSKLTLIAKVDRYTSDNVNNAVYGMVKPYLDYLHSVTLDNGPEFADHEALAKKIGADIYFAHPYHSWERGLNENTNGLIRQYFPKKTDFRKITSTQIRKVQDRLNQRPRKSLGYLSPYEQFIKEQNIN